MLSLQEAGLLSIMPCRNIVSNRGYGTGGTHTEGFAYDQYLHAKAFEMPFPLVHPATVDRDKKSDLLYERRYFAWLPRILTIVGLKLGAFGRGIAQTMHPVERMAPWLFRI